MGSRLRPESLLLMAASSFLALGLQAAGPGLAPSSLSPRPVAVVIEALLAAGEVDRGEGLSGEFLVQNEGDAPLELRAGRTGCAARVARCDSPVAPGATGRVEVIVDTSELQGALATHVLVSTNDPSSPVLRLTIDLSVRSPIEVLPSPTLHVMQWEGEAVRQELSLRASGVAAFDVLSVDSSDARIRHELLAPTPGAAGARIAVWLDPAAAPGRVDGSLHVTTSLPAAPRVEVAVQGDVLGLLIASPAALYFQADGPGRPVVPRGPGLNVRARPDSAAPVLRRIAGTGPLRAVDVSGDWTRVELDDGSSGWAATRLLLEPLPSAWPARLVTVRHRGEVPFSLDGARIEGLAGLVAVAGLRPEQADRHELTVTCLDQPPRGTLTGSIVLATSLPGTPELRIPVVIRGWAR